MLQRQSKFVFIFIAIVCVESCGLIYPSHHQVTDYTPIFAATDACNLTKVRQAVDNNPGLLKATEWDHATLLHDAVGHNCRELTNYLLKKGSDVNATMDDRITPLHLAAQRGNTTIANLLLQNGAKINAIDAKGWTPVDRAEKWKHNDTAEFLIKHGGHAGTSNTNPTLEKY